MQLIPIKPDTKISIVTKSGFIFNSRVCEAINEHSFLIYTPIEQGGLVKLPINKEYTFMFYTKDRLYQAEGRVSEYGYQNKVNLMKIKVGEFKLVQRRQFYRVALRLPFTYHRLKEVSETVSKAELPVYRGIVENLSGSGLRFSAGKMLTEEEHILCNLILRGIPVVAEGEILSVDPSNYNKRIYIHRVRLVNMEKDQQEKIVQFVFQKEREQIKRRRMTGDIK